MTVAQAVKTFEVIPSIDILDGEVVRLLRGDYERVTRYGAARDVVRRWEAPNILHGYPSNRLAKPVMQRNDRRGNRPAFYDNRKHGNQGTRGRGGR